MTSYKILIPHNIKTIKPTISITYTNFNPLLTLSTPFFLLNRKPVNSQTWLQGMLVRKDVNFEK